MLTIIKKAMGEQEQLSYERYDEGYGKKHILEPLDNKKLYEPKPRFEFDVKGNIKYIISKFVKRRNKNN